MQVIGGDNLEHLRGKQVIVVEDIVDTGNTIRKLMNVLAKYDPKSVKGAFFTQKTLFSLKDPPPLFLGILGMFRASQ